jgi:hypothetical protein
MVRYVLAASIALVVACDAASAQTKFYFPSDITAPVSPAFGAPGGSSAWAQTGNAVRQGMTTGAGSFNDSGQTIQHTTTNPELTLYRQYSICNLAAQTIDGTVKGVFRSNEGAATANAFLAVGIYVTDSAGTTVRGVSLAISFPDAATHEFSTPGGASRQVRDINESMTPTLSSVNAQAGDCLVVEIGTRDTSTGGSDTANITWRNNQGNGDLPENETSQAGDNWMQFSDTITFAGGSAKGCIIGGGIMMPGCIG